MAFELVATHERDCSSPALRAQRLRRREIEIQRQVASLASHSYESRFFGTLGLPTRAKSRPPTTVVSSFFLELAHLANP